MYNGHKVMITRQFAISGKQYVDLKDLTSGKQYKSIRVEKLGVKPVEVVPDKVLFEKGDKKTELAKGSKEYDEFLAKNKLNPKFVENCLKGLSKTHKGFVIRYA